MQYTITANPKNFCDKVSRPLIAGDDSAYLVSVQCGKAYPPPEPEVRAVARHSNGTAFEGYGQWQNGCAQITLPASWYAIPGELTIRMIVAHGEHVLTLKELIFDVSA